jgi:hypothetical protein
MLLYPGCEFGEKMSSGCCNPFAIKEKLEENPERSCEPQTGALFE